MCHSPSPFVGLRLLRHIISCRCPFFLRYYLHSELELTELFRFFVSRGSRFNPVLDMLASFKKGNIGGVKVHVDRLQVCKNPAFASTLSPTHQAMVTRDYRICQSLVSNYIIFKCCKLSEIRME